MICRKYGIKTHFKGNRTIKNILIQPRDKDPLERKSEVITWYQCVKLTYNEECIGETLMTFRERYKEHLKELSAFYGQSNQAEHSTDPENFTIIGREDHGLARTIKEQIYIRCQQPHTQWECG